MKQEWLDIILRLSLKKSSLYSGCRKIHTNVHFALHDLWDAEDPLVMSDIGYTKSKMAHLVRGYVHEESIEVALMLWERRRGQRSYGSVGITCYNHFLKNDPENKSKRASVMGPCIQALTITQTKGNNSKGEGGRYRIDAFYRTTELLKKFPADLIFIRDILLKDFDFSGMEFEGLFFHFANVTVHPQYMVTAIPHMDDPIAFLEKLREKEEYFFNWVIKWTARYLCPEHFRGIAKFAQALRVKDHADEAITGKKRKKLIKYLNKHHPGYRDAYVDPDEVDQTEGEE